MLILNSIKDFIKKAEVGDPVVKEKHLLLLRSKSYLRDNKAKDHFCVYFAGVDAKKKKVLIGHHKKANLWLFNGGHLDQNETVEEGLFREISEEWNVEIPKKAVLPFTRLSITPIDNPKQPNCSNHYDLWHFISLDSEAFQPDKEKIATEFYEIRWVTIPEALKLSNEVNTKAGLSWLEKNLLFVSNRH